MNEIKFACPSCGQHIQCDEAYVGRKIVCPMCRAEIAVPRTAPGQPGGTLPEAHLIAASPGRAPSEPVHSGARKPVSSNRAGTPECPTLERKPGAGGSGSAESRPEGSTVQKPAERALEANAGVRVSAAAGPGPDVHLLCPVCRSELGVPPGIPPAAASKAVRRAILIRRAEQAPVASVAANATAHGDGDEEKHEPRRPSPAERIGRSGPEIKPRLSYILTGEPPKPTAESKSNPES